MNKSLLLTLSRMQGDLFVLAGNKGYASAAFLEGFMRSDVAADLDKPFNHMQWAGLSYIMSRTEEELGDSLISEGEVYDQETLFWSGYLFRYWNITLGEPSRLIYKQAPAKTMQVLYLMYHTMSPEVAIDRIKESYTCKHHKKSSRQITH